jgi:uncharacterized Tic20 family protein
METNSSKTDQNLAAVAHLSSLVKFVFPFFHLVIPLGLWIGFSQGSRFVELHTRKAVNFQISLLLYSISVALVMGIIIGILFLSVGREAWLSGEFPLLGHATHFAIFISVTVIGSVTLLGLLIADVYYSIKAASAASQGEEANYPLSLNLLGKSNQIQEPAI